MSNIVWIDAETTCFDPEKGDMHELAAVWQHRQFQVYIEYDETIVAHKLPIPQHVKRFPLNQAMIWFANWLSNCSEQLNKNIPGDKQLLRHGGQNPYFDHKWLSKSPLYRIIHEQLFGYKFIDLYSKSVLMQDIGLLPKNQSLKLEKLVEYYKIPCTPHQALEDVLATIAIDKIYTNELRTKMDIFDRITTGKTT